MAVSAPVTFTDSHIHTKPTQQEHSKTLKKKKSLHGLTFYPERAESTSGAS